jgi:hypothetical protein
VVVFVESRSKLIKMTAIGASFAVIGGLWVWTGGPKSGRASGPIAMAVMVAGLAMGLLVLAYYVPRLFRSPRVLLTLDADGFDDRSSLMAAGRVRWSEVRELAIVRVSRNDSIAARVTDPERLQRSRSGVARLTASANRRWADVWISCATSNATTVDVFEQMRRRWEASTAGRVSSDPRD